MRSAGESTQLGALIVNADDWGRDHQTTERTLQCILRKTVSSVSAMVFMEDSDRSASIARERGIDAGLHLNLTTDLTAPSVSTTLLEHHHRIHRYLRRHRLAQAVYHPGLARSFEYVVQSQREEYARLYGAEATRFDGHHHMHLCANLLLRGLLPAGTIVRRNFSFQPGEKGRFNRAYRQIVDRVLAARHQLTDYFFSLPPLVPAGRIRQIFALASECIVEVETHPVNPDEFQFLMEDAVLDYSGGISIAPRFAVPRRVRASDR